MGRKEKLKGKAIEHGEEDNSNGTVTPSLVFSSDDDDEANQDLSLKIVEKAMRMRATKLAANDVVLSAGRNELVVPQNGGVLDGPSGIDASEVTEKKKAKLKVEAGDQSVIMADEEEAEETIEATENHESAEGIVVAQMGDNMVLRKLLRGPRYFDPPDSSWGACFNCGEQGHAAVNCTAAKRKKPCYVCGGLGHNAKQCSKIQNCFICKKGGHRAKDCPDKHASASKGVKICLKCGDSGHDMFSCRNDYALDDLKEIKCYVCKKLGHLCCVNTDDATPGEFSCYKCGQLGHTGLACSRLREETTSGATPSSCFKCGEEGHFARECTSSIKGGKWNRDSSNGKDKKSLKGSPMGYRSAPHDMGKSRKKKRPDEERGLSTPKKSKSRGGWTMEHPREERGFTTPKKSKSRGGWTMDHPAEERDFSTPKKAKSRGGWTTDHPREEKGFTTPKKLKSRGGWMAEHPGEFSPSISTGSNWRFSGIPSSRGNKIHSFVNGSHTPSFKYSNAWNGHAGTSRSQGSSAMGNHHKFSASRFGNTSSDGHGRNYNW